MATSGTAVFNLDLTELAEEAFERCGKELRSGYDLRTARRSLNLMMMEWANRGLNMWTMEQGSIPLDVGVATYALPADTVDIIEHTIRTGADQNQSDIAITRIAMPVYMAIPNKNQTGRPLQLMVNRKVDVPELTVWPVPDVSGYTLVYWRLRRMQDMGGGTSTADVPFRFVPALVSGLAFYIAMKLPDIDPNRAVYLKSEYEQQFALASLEDRERATLRIIPRIGR